MDPKLFSTETWTWTPNNQKITKTRKQKWNMNSFIF